MYAVRPRRFERYVYHVNQQYVCRSHAAPSREGATIVLSVKDVSSATAPSEEHVIVR